MRRGPGFPPHPTLAWLASTSPARGEGGMGRGGAQGAALLFRTVSGMVPEAEGIKQL